jgi:DNA-binding NarL/FixJ family response regulator
VALETFRRLGAAPWARRAEAGLRACGVTTAAAPTAAGAPADLTAQQREIVILANGGLTNSEIADRLALSLLTAASHPTCTPRLPANEVSAEPATGGTLG